MEIGNIKTYQEGFQASHIAKSNPRLVSNPYPEDSPEWQSWNQGWNSDVRIRQKRLLREIRRK
jgi:hypothetical protein